MKKVNVNLKVAPTPGNCTYFEIRNYRGTPAWTHGQSCVCSLMQAIFQRVLCVPQLSNEDQLQRTL